MEFSQEQIEELGLSEDQVSKVQELTSDYEANLKKDWDGIANENAERIISGAADKVKQLTGIERQQGQKVADYLSFASEKYFETTKTALQQKEKELETKLKSGGDDVLKSELEKTKAKLDELKQKEAKFAEWEENDYKGKWEQSQTELTGLRKTTAYNSAKPTFPESVNKYEAAAKWGDFLKTVDEKYNIELGDGKAIAVDKENEHKKIPLEELVKKDKSIQELVQGRQAVGFGKQGKKEKIEGIPFEIEEGSSKSDISKQIKEYLVSEKKLNPISKEYSKEFADLYSKITQKTAK